MNIATEINNERTVLSVQEERVDAHNSQAFKEFLQRTVENEGANLIVDLSAVKFIDSSGLGALLSGYKNANLRHGRFVLCGLNVRVQSMFELTRLNKVFTIFPTLQEALDQP